MPWLDFQASASKPVISSRNTITLVASPVRNNTMVASSSLKEPDLHKPDVPLRCVTEVANKLLPYKTFEKK